MLIYNHGRDNKPKLKNRKDLIIMKEMLARVIAWASVEKAFDDNDMEADAVLDLIYDLADADVVENISDECGIGLIYNGVEYYRHYDFKD